MKSLTQEEISLVSGPVKTSLDLSVLCMDPLQWDRADKPGPDMKLDTLRGVIQGPKRLSQQLIQIKAPPGSKHPVNLQPMVTDNT